MRTPACPRASRKLFTIEGLHRHELLCCPDFGARPESHTRCRRRSQFASTIYLVGDHQRDNHTTSEAGPFLFCAGIPSRRSSDRPDPNRDSRCRDSDEGLGPICPVGGIWGGCNRLLKLRCDVGTRNPACAYLRWPFSDCGIRNVPDRDVVARRDSSVVYSIAYPLVGAPQNLGRRTA